MVSKAKPSEFIYKGIELCDVHHICTKTYYKEIEKFIQITSPDQRKRFETAIFNIVGMLNANIYYKNRPTPLQIRAALKNIQISVRQLRKALGKLDNDTRELLKEVAGRDPYDPQSEPPFKISWSTLRYNEALDWNRRLHAWIINALRELPIKAKSGRKSKNAEQEAVNELKKLWIYYKGKPTLITSSKTGDPTGAFLHFVQTALTPVLQANGIKETKLEHYVRGALYGENKGKNKPK